MSLKRLAELTGLSIASVSKAFSGSREISEPTRERVYAVARAEGCFDKYYKGKRKRPLIALIFPESEGGYYSREIGLLEREIYRRGADTVIALSRFDPERVSSFFRELVYNTGVDAVIIRDTAAKKIRNVDRIPLTTVGNRSQSVEYSSRFFADFDKAMCDLVRLLKDYGHREIGFIGEKLTQGKLRNFKSALRYQGLPINERCVAVSQRRFAAAGEEGMKKILATGCRPTAIVTAYDDIAYGAMRYAEANGLSIPDDISFVGIDDLTINDYSGYRLTSLHVCFEDYVSEIVDSVMRRIEDRSGEIVGPIEMPIKLIIRDTLKKIE